MGKGSSSQNSTVTNQSIPKEFFPYFGRILDRAEASSLEPYQPYQGQRLADQSGDTSNSYGMIRNVAANGMPTTRGAIGQTQNAYNQMGQLGSGGPYQYSQYGFSDAGTFNPQAAGQYMSPYMQNVVNGQKMSAVEDFQMANAARNAQAVNAGAFGGSRQAVQQGLAERDLLARTNQIQNEGLQSSYEDAQRMFEQDRAARMATDQSRAGELARVQSGQAGENLAYANFDMSKLQAQTDMSRQMASLEQAARAGDIQAAQLLEAAGKSQEQRQQASMDMGYQDYQRQMGYPMDMLERYAGILHGSPVANATTTTTSTPVNTGAQILGTGISALGLINAMG